jgi:hypothetical protein
MQEVRVGLFIVAKQFGVRLFIPFGLDLCPSLLYFYGSCLFG